MTVLASDDYTGVGGGASIGSRTLNNALGGTGTRGYVSQGPTNFLGNGAGALLRDTNNSNNFTSVSGAGKTRIKLTSTSTTPIVAVTMRRSVVTGGNNERVLVCLANAHTTLDIREYNGSGFSTRATEAITPPTGTYYLELEIAGLVVTGRLLNSTLALIQTASWTATTLPSGDLCGFEYLGSGSPNMTLDDFVVEDGGAADNTAPTLTGVSGASTSPTAATISATTDEAGPGWAVYTGSATQPTKAQVKAGQDHTGSTTGVFADTATLAIGANPAAFSFAGMTPEGVYYPHVVQDDEADTPNTSDVESGSSVTMPALPLKAAVTLYEEDGTTPAASITGLQWAWWDDATPDLSLAADVSGTGASTNGSGVFDVTLTGTALELGDTGTLLIYKTDGTAESTATLSFCGPLEVVN